MAVPNVQERTRGMLDINYDLLIAVMLLIAGTIVVLNSEALAGSRDYVIIWVAIFAWNLILLARALRAYHHRTSTVQVWQGSIWWLASVVLWGFILAILVSSGFAVNPFDHATEIRTIVLAAASGIGVASAVGLWISAAMTAQ